MWKSIIITTTLMLFGACNVHAADFGYKQDTKKEQASVVMNDEMSFNDLFNGLNITEDLNTNLIFGLDQGHYSNHEGPDDLPGTTGIGIGFSFSF